MDRQNRQLTLLSLVLLVMVAFVVLDWDRSGEEKPSDDNAPETTDVFDYQPGEIVKVTLKRPADTVSFELKDGAWQITSPVVTLAEAGSVDGILTRFESLRMEERDLPGAKADYGLDEASRIEVRLEKIDGTAFTAYVGHDAKVGYKSFGMIPGDDAAHVFDGQVGKLVSKSADEFRGRDMFAFSPSSVRRIRLVDAGVETVLRKDDVGWWIGDTGPRADDDKVGAYLSSVTLVKVERFLDGQTIAALGLDSPVGTVAIEDDNGTHTVKLSAADADGVNAASGDVPVRLSAEDRATLLPADGWASDRLFQVQSWKVDAVAIALGTTKLELNRKDGSWLKADGSAIENASDIVDVLLDLPVNRTASVAMAGTYGRVSIGIGKGKAVVVQVGDEAAEGGRLAKEEGGGPAFVIPADTLALLSDAAAGKAPHKEEPVEDMGGGGMPPGMDLDALLKSMGGPPPE